MTILETNYLLGTIAFLLITLNVNTQILKSTIQKTNKLYENLVRYLKADIRIRARLEKKANWIFRKVGIDIEKFNIDALEDIDEEIELYD